MGDIDRLTEFYVNEIVDNSQKYLERDKHLLRRLVRQSLDQYAVKREAQIKAQQP